MENIDFFLTQYVNNPDELAKFLSAIQTAKDLHAKLSDISRLRSAIEAMHSPTFEEMLPHFRTFLASDSIREYFDQEINCSQLPADELSISLNIMENTLSAAATDQYIVDVMSDTVKTIVDRNSKISMLSIAAAIGSDNTIDIIEHISKSHARPLVRLAALKSLGSRATSPNERIEILMRGFQDSSKLVRESIKVEVQKVNEALGENVRRIN